MKTAVIRNLNEIVSLTVLAMMVVALIAGQVNMLGHAAAGDELSLQVTSIRHNGE
jgi:hypothetical protein